MENLCERLVRNVFLFNRRVFWLSHSGSVRPAIFYPFSDFRYWGDIIFRTIDRGFIHW